MTKKSGEIKLRGFDHIVLWPLLLRGPDTKAEENERSVQPFIDALKREGWQEPQVQGQGVDPAYSCEEILYFHLFVRDFLFGDGSKKPDQRAVRRMVRTDITRVRLGLATGNWSETEPREIELDVQAIELFLIRPRVAILMVEVSKPEGLDLTLQDALLIQTQFHRAYPPYFKPDGTHGDCPRSVQWEGLAAADALSSRSSREEFEEFTRVGAEPPVYAHWRALFGKGIQPLRCARELQEQTPCGATDPPAPQRALRLQQLVDDRMPAMSYIVVDDPTEIDIDDEDRLPAFDPPGFGYDPAFRDRIRDQQRYVRFRHWGTTYYGNGSFLAVVTSQDDFTAILRTHFRRHYRLLAMLAHYQHSALLYFEDEMADIAKDTSSLDESNTEANRRWTRRVRRHQRQFLEFRTGSYFTEVSNQIQGKDLFRFWIEPLRTEELFHRVAQSNAALYDALEKSEMRQMTEAQQNETRRTTVLTKVAGIGLAISILAGLTSAVADFWGDFYSVAPAPWWRAYRGPGIATLVFAAYLLLWYIYARWYTNRDARPTNDSV